MLNVIFLGSGDFALSILKSLILDERINLLAVVTQPKSEVGRKKELKPTAVGAYTIVIAVSNPNGNADPNPADNSATFVVNVIDTFIQRIIW